MKKINLKSVLESLSRDEMRTISGGSGGDGGGCNTDPSCETTGCSYFVKGTGLPFRRCSYCCLA